VGDQRRIAALPTLPPEPLDCLHRYGHRTISGRQRYAGITASDHSVEPSAQRLQAARPMMRSIVLVWRRMELCLL
jgi:hypothetical protein